MKKFEYKLIAAPLISDLDEYINWLNSLGSMGWQLVDLHRNRNDVAHSILFMREVQTQNEESNNAITNTETETDLNYRYPNYNLTKE